MHKYLLTRVNKGAWAPSIKVVTGAQGPTTLPALLLSHGALYQKEAPALWRHTSSNKCLFPRQASAQAFALFSKTKSPHFSFWLITPQIHYFFTVNPMAFPSFRF